MGSPMSTSPASRAPRQLHGIVALVPFRSLRDGKRRLANVLNDAERAALIAAMLKDTLSALLNCQQLDDVIVVTDDATAAALARDLGAVSLAEPAGFEGLNAVVQQSSVQLQADYDALLVVHGDLPLLSSDEVDYLIEQHLAFAEPPSMSIVADRHETGSNCLLCSPADAMRYHYGPGSFSKHLAYAQQQGISAQHIRLDGARLDVDEPDDLRALRTHPGLASATHVKQSLA